MVDSVAENFPPSIYGPMLEASPASLSTPSVPSAPAGGAGLNIRAGGYELSVGGAAGSGLYRTNPNEVGASFQVPQGAAQVAEGIRDGAGRLWGNVRQRYEDRISRTTSPQSGR